MNPEVITGKKIVIAMISVMLLISLGSILLYTFQNGADKFSSQIIRFSATLILCYFMYKGKELARRTAATLTILSTIVCIIAAVGTFSFQAVTILMILLAIVYGTMSALLIGSNQVKAYFEYQSNRINDKNERSSI